MSLSPLFVLFYSAAYVGCIQYSEWCARALLYRRIYSGAACITYSIVLGRREYTYIIVRYICVCQCARISLSLYRRVTRPSDAVYIFTHINRGPHNRFGDVNSAGRTKVLPIPSFPFSLSATDPATSARHPERERGTSAQRERDRKEKELDTRQVRVRLLCS